MLVVPPSTRLNYSLLSAEDAELLWELDQDTEVMRYINGGERTAMARIVEVMIPRMMSYRSPTQGYGIWQVRQGDNNAYLGWILIRPMDFHSDTPSTVDAEIGWRFKRSHWGQGYAVEAASAIAAAVLAKNSQLRFLSAIAMPDNAGSIGVMRKLGMQFVKRFMHRDALGDVDAVLYRLAVKGANKDD
jgi:RimJ/RimL family protein N-acetyltransferase